MTLPYYVGAITNKGLQQHARDMARAAGLTGIRHGWASMSGLSEARSRALASASTDRAGSIAAYEAAVMARISDDAGWAAAEAAGYGSPSQRRGARGRELDGLAYGEMLAQEGYTDDEIEDMGGVL